MNEAVQTSLLPKRGCYLWSFMPTLLLPLSVPSLHFIANALKLCSTNKVDTIRLFIIHLGARLPTSDEIDSWLHLACCREVQNLNVDPRFLNPHYNSDCVTRWFTNKCCCFSTLKLLSLSSNCLTSLECLVLQNLFLADNIIEEITSSCPMFRHLILDDCNVNVPLRVSIINPKTSKLSIFYDSRSTGMLKLCAPYLSTLIIGPNLAHKCTTVLLAHLCTLKLAHSEIGFYQHGWASLLQILNGLPTKELFVNSMCLFV